MRIREKKDKSRTAAFFGGILKNVKNALFTEQDGEEIETENAEFNRQFKIKASDGELAFYILTPQFMESVLRLDALAGGDTNIVFQGTGVTVTCNNGKDSFELKRILRSRKGLEKQRQRFRQERDVILQIFDEILTKDNLFV